MKMKSLLLTAMLTMSLWVPAHADESAEGATVCQEFQTQSGENCQHRCNDTYFIWNGTACVRCPENQFRTSPQVNTCQAEAACPAGSTAVHEDFGLDANTPEQIKTTCRLSNGVLVKVNMLGQLYNNFDEPITEVPEPCPNSGDSSLQRDAGGRCRNRCRGEVNEHYQNFTFLNNASTDDANCESCPSNKVVVEGTNTCECPNGTTWVEARSRCENAATAAIFERASTNCNWTSRNESECKGACTQLREMYLRQPELQLEMIECGNYLPEIGNGPNIPNGFSWEGTPTILRMSAGYGSCGVDHEVCFGPIRGQVGMGGSGSGTSRETVTMMAKCYIPKNALSCPTNLTEDRNCQIANYVSDRAEHPGVLPCSGNSRGRCMCGGRVVNSNSNCSTTTRSQRITQRCAGSNRNTRECIHACVEVDYANPACPTREAALEILSTPNHL